MIKKKQIEFKSTNGFSRIKGLVYIPDSEPKAILQISHGMCEHIGRYDDFCRYLCGEGFIVCAHDHAGHGKSVSDMNELGYFAPTNGWQVLVDDLYKFTRIVKKLFPGKDVFVLGHSMGSFIARLYASYYSYSVSGLIISGTGGKNNKALAAIALCDIKSKIQGDRYRSESINKMAFGDFNKNFQPITTGMEWLSRDEEICKAHANDPYCDFLFTTSAFRDLFTLTYKANDKMTFINTVASLPILMVSGDNDPVGDYGKGVTEVYQNYKKYGNDDITLKLYHGGRHEMLNEINRTEVYEDIKNWILDRTK